MVHWSWRYELHVNVESELEQKIEAFCKKTGRNEVPLFAKPD